MADTYYAGFDSLEYPGIDAMNWLFVAANSNLQWCGYYLAPAPNRPTSGWQGQYTSLKDSWGIAPIYVGQQDPKTHNPKCTLTAEQGVLDAAEALALAQADQFPDKTCVYLDWEQGDITAAGAADYIKAWVKAVDDDGRIRPGIYCTHAAAQKIANVIDTLNPTPIVRFWCVKVSSTADHDFTGKLTEIPAIDPAGSGFAAALMWQREQNAKVTFPADAPISRLKMDFDTSAMKDPGAPPTRARSGRVKVAARRPAKGRRKSAMKRSKRSAVRPGKTKSKPARAKRGVKSAKRRGAGKRKSSRRR
jgi:hypothetical protein